MIGLIFSFGTEIIEIRIDGNNILFRNNQSGFTTIDGIKLDKLGVIKEFPDLKDNENWQNIARQRFKDKIKSFNTEMEKANYIIEDLKQFGYKPMYKQRRGFRVEKF
jgi:hypothetical protein